MFTLRIKTSGDAFLDHERPDENGVPILDPDGTEVRRILKEVARKLEAGYDVGTVMDRNGNSVGFWKYE